MLTHCLRFCGSSTFPGCSANCSRAASRSPQLRPTLATKWIFPALFQNLKVLLLICYVRGSISIYCSFLNAFSTAGLLDILNTIITSILHSTTYLELRWKKNPQLKVGLPCCMLFTCQEIDFASKIHFWCNIPTSPRARGTKQTKTRLWGFQSARRGRVAPLQMLLLLEHERHERHVEFAKTIFKIVRTLLLDQKLLIQSIYYDCLSGSLGDVWLSTDFS